MTPQTKKGLIITAVVGVLIFAAIKVMAKKPTALPNANLDTGASGGTDGGVGVLNIPTVNTSVIGKTASARIDNVYVHKDADDYSNLVYNNIIGILKKGESAGTISSSAIGTDGGVWYEVGRASEYNCDWDTCGIHLSHSSGWVKSSEVNLF